MVKTTVNLDSEIVQSLLQGDLTCLQSVVKDLIEHAFEAKAEEILQAERYERTPDRKGYRNGYRSRWMTTRIGRISIRVPQMRGGGLDTEELKLLPRFEQAFLLTLLEMVINGVSTRKVRRVMEELCGLGVSKSTVSRLCGLLHGRVAEWNERPLEGTDYPFLQADALVIRVRENRKVVKKVIQLAIGVSDAGYREVLGIRVARQESEVSWTEFFTWLNRRGLAGVDYVTSDDHEGLKLALGKTLPHVVWQRCQTHFSRNLLDKVYKKDRQQVHAMLKYMYDAPTKEKALESAEDLMDFLEERYPEAMDILDNAKEDILAVYDLPAHCRKKMRTTNMTERTNEELRRRERVIRIFPNDASAMMLAGAYLQELSEEWISGRRYMDMAEFHEVKAKQERKGKASVKQPVNMAKPKAVA
ncbi:MAG: IS256 family transposase, partial [Thermovirgaceae bacterium]|nr:IS256 family transposase [Thermovirgaceae bacterium]